jgi:hypothetical protein
LESETLVVAVCSPGTRTILQESNEGWKEKSGKFEGSKEDKKEI